MCFINKIKRKIVERGKFSLLFSILIFGMAVVTLWLEEGITVWAAWGLAAPKGILANGVGTNVVISWEPVKKAEGYEVYEKSESQKGYRKVKVTSGKKVVLSGKNRGENYSYKVRAYKRASGKTKYGKFSKQSETSIAVQGLTTTKNFLRVAMAPVGSVMYIWGGGWNKKDTGAGADGVRIGLNPNWRRYASKQKSSYNYRKTRYKRGYGLDCSGYVGWVLYNTMHTKKGKQGAGYVDKANKIARNCAKEGWGTYRKASSITDYRPGDIMSSSTHVYIVIGKCSDGSVVLVHSSPAGVQICGTVSSSGKRVSKAVKLAKTYMKKYYPSWYRRYPECSRDLSYLKKYNQFRWKLSKGSIMDDPDQYRNRSPKHILKDLFGEK